MTPKFEFVDPYQAIKTCTWCGETIPDHTTRLSLGAKARPGLELETLEGKAVVIRFLISKKKVTAVIPLNDSNAKKAGHDLVFAVCSEACGETLKEALQQEKEIFENVN